MFYITTTHSHLKDIPFSGLKIIFAFTFTNQTQNVFSYHIFTILPLVTVFTKVIKEEQKTKKIVIQCYLVNFYKEDFQDITNDI